MEFIAAMQFVSSVPGVIQPNGIQPVALTFTGVNSNMSCTINTDMADPITGLTGAVWLRLDDTLPSMAIPAAGVAVSENTASVVTATVEQVAPPTAV
jgi:hypothetical protein